MPLLAAEPTHFPESLFVPEAAPDTQAGEWWVLHTRPRQEKALARQLLQRQVPFYLPTVSRKLMCRGRRLTAHVPLFPGYAFLLANMEQRLAALTTNRIVQVLRVSDQERIWQDLRQVQRLLASGEPVVPEDRLAPGVEVEIRHGPLAGLKGKIVKAATGNRFVVAVDFIQRGASVVMEDHYLAALI
jgi:transcription antitermination factor NusG